MLDKVLHLIIITWEGKQKSFSANMMNGAARLIYAYGAELKKLDVISIKEISKLAKERRAGFLGYAEDMLIFNSKRMNNPPSRKALYMNKLEKGKSIVRPIQQPEGKVQESPHHEGDIITKIQAG